MSSQEIYYKATKAKGVSGYDPNFIYHLGINAHPNPDRKSNDACGEGIHLAKSIEIAKSLCSDWKEIYEAKAGVILGEDSKKIRVASCVLVRRIEHSDFKMPNCPSLNDEWLDKHLYDITPDDIANQTLEIIEDDKVKICLKASMRKKDARDALKLVVGKV